MSDDRLNPQNDAFGPRAVPTEVFCLHCGEEFESYLIEWRIERLADGSQHGFWFCPTPGCDDKGFGFDLLPTDPEYRDENGGWVWHDDEEGEDDDYLEGDFDEQLPVQNDTAVMEPDDEEEDDRFL